MSAVEDMGAGLGRLRKRAGSEAVAHFPKEKNFSFLFQTNSPKIPILNLKNSFSKSDSKTNFVLNFEIFNFAKRSKVKIPKDFELRI
jgi:hypothetical protein